jgi:hypothetical protein
MVEAIVTEKSGRKQRLSLSLEVVQRSLDISRSGVADIRARFNEKYLRELKTDVERDRFSFCRYTEVMAEFFLSE